jgi:quinol monooxygenase YgiN
MHILIVHAHIKPEFIDAFIAATKINAENSAREPGVARFELMQQQDDPARFVLCEVYRDAAAPARHKESAHYNAWIETVNDMFVTPRTRAFYTNLAPADAAYGS